MWFLIYPLFLDFDYNGQTRRQLRYKIYDHRVKVRNEGVYNFSIASPCCSYNPCFDFDKANIISYSNLSSHLDFH